MKKGDEKFNIGLKHSGVRLMVELIKVSVYSVSTTLPLTYILIFYYHNHAVYYHPQIVIYHYDLPTNFNIYFDYRLKIRTIVTKLVYKVLDFRLRVPNLFLFNLTQTILVFIWVGCNCLVKRLILWLHLIIFVIVLPLHLSPLQC